VLIHALASDAYWIKRPQDVILVAVLSKFKPHLTYMEYPMKHMLIITGILTLAACSADPGSEKWCAAKKEQPKSEWTGSDVKTYTKSCLIDGMAIGSEEWCAELSGKPKGEWTADEASAYAKNCVM
jgi:hypothetical protein